MVYKNAPLVCSNGAYDGSENRTRFCYLAAFNPRITAEENPAASISFRPFTPFAHPRSASPDIFF